MNQWSVQKYIELMGRLFAATAGHTPATATRLGIVWATVAHRHGW